MKNILLILLAFLFATSCSNESNKLDLAGDWQFAIDQKDVGEAQKWYAETLTETIQLPGSMMTNNKGFDPTLKTEWTGSIYDSSFFFNPTLEKYRKEGEIKFPFWLTPNKYYKGAAWYRKEILLPSTWKEKRVILFMERPHWQTTVWINGKKAGMQNSLSTAHQYDITNLVKDGLNAITIVVDNRSDQVNVGPDSHSISDHTQGNWNGIIGDIYLEAKEQVFIDDLQIFPDVDNQKVTARIKIKNHTEVSTNSELKLQVNNGNSTLETLSKPIAIKAKDQIIEIEYSMGQNVKLWDEFTPNIYEMKVALNIDGQTQDIATSTFGMRKIETYDGKIFINDRQIYMRGTLECSTFPITGYPPTDLESWKKVLGAIKESGLNHVRFHSHCPPEAAFTAADELGIYLQPEAASWPNHGTSLGNNRPIDDYIIAETDRIIKAYGNHPSFVMWAYCNEPYGRYVPFLNEDLKKRKEEDNRRIYTAAAIGKSWSVNPESEFIVRSYPRGLPFKKQPNSSFNYEDRISNESRAYVTHEMGQYCVFPDFKEIDKYTGVYKARNFEMFRDILNDHHMGDQANDFLMASGKLQALCYKAEIEGQLRTSTLDGFQLLGLNDFPGQGSAIIGLLNVFWEEKGYITKEEIKAFCGATVPLAKFNKFVFTNDEKLSIPISIAHFGQNDLENVSPKITITSNGVQLFETTLETKTIPTSQLSDLGIIEFNLNKLSKASQCKLEVSIGTFKNSWDFWVYPTEKQPVKEDAIYYTTSFDQKTIDKLNAGAKVLLDASGKVENGKDIVANFTPVFWNTSWFQMRPPHTTGLLIQENHPIFSDFPTSYHSDYQWWELVNGQQIMQIDNFPESFRPIVQPIDTWFLSRRLAQLFEVKIGEGKLIVTSLNIDPSNGPASSQLYKSIVQYMNSVDFNPQDEMKSSTIEELFEVKVRQKVNMYTKDSPDELQPNRKKKK